MEKKFEGGQDGNNEENLLLEQQQQELAEIDPDLGGISAPTANRLPFPTVAIGASAGGLQAFTELLRGLPATTGMSFVLVQHLHPKHVSILSQLLARETKMAVEEVEDGVKVQPNHVYVIPRGTLMRMEAGTLTVAPREHGPGAHMPVDVFFRSLARDQGSNAMGVVLSGTDGDGASGLKDIKAMGGLVFVQSPESATFPGMPMTAISTGHADIIGTPGEIAAEMVRISRNPAQQVLKKGVEEIEESGDEALRPIFAQLKATSGVEFEHYKRSTITRRILRRVYLNKLNSVRAYGEFLRGNKAEVSALYEDLLINVTEFFRDPEVFDALKATVFPKIMEQKRANTPIRVWVPGCSTGEEVYSIAMALVEYLEERIADTPVHIFATDISENALQHARTGLYAEIALREMSPHRLRRFFSRQEQGYQVNSRIREMCVFARQDVTRDPPFSKLDLISCRNVLIYLDSVLQKRVIPTFQYALRNNGFLLVGSSESISSAPEHFHLFDKTHKIYVRAAGVARPALQFKVSSPLERVAPDKFDDPWTDRDLQREADRMILARHAHPAVVIDEDFTILQFRGRTGSFLEASPGVASLNLLRMSREGLILEIRNAVQECRDSGQPVRREHLRINVENKLKDVSFEVIPFKREYPGGQRYLVLFEEPLGEGAITPVPLTPPLESPPARGEEAEQLRRDLKATHEYLQSIIEEHDASIEELRSANEEILSANEELQSTNEELETAKEELQSANEELSTLNEELQNRNLQLGQASNDLLNLLTNVSIAIVMIGNDLRIRRFTPASEKLLNLIPTDVGRPITDIQFNVEINDLRRLLLDVMENLSPKVIDLEDYNGGTYSLRLRPYRTDDNRIEGVVMVLIDVGGPTTGKGGLREAGRSDQELSAAELILAQEEERRRLARELHDELSQRLALLEVTAEMLERRPEVAETELAEELGLIRQQVGELSTDVRRIAYRLHPTILEDLGLAVALSSYLDQVKAWDKVDVALTLRDVPPLRPAVALAVYRIVQEAVRNAGKHAPGSRVEVSLQRVENQLSLRITDDGPGFDSGNQRMRGLGLTSMEERTRSVGGSFKVNSRLGEGTEICVDITIS